MRIPNKLEKKGFFWLQESENHRVPGVLTITDGGVINLELLGSLITNSQEYIRSTNLHDFFTVFGILEDKKKITLEKCFYTKRSMVNDPLSPTNIFAHKALLGVLCDIKSETFKKCLFSVEGLDEWIGICGITVDYPSETSRFNGKLHYDLPETIEFAIGDELKLKIEFEGTLPGFPIIREAKVTQKAYITIESESYKKIDDFINIVYKIVQFLNFAIDKNVCIDSFKVCHSLNNTQECYDVFYQSIPFFQYPSKIEWHSIFIPFGKLENNFEKVIDKWLKAYGFIKPSLALYFYAKSGEHKYIDGRFLSVVQALETYSRRLFNRKMIDEQSYQDLKSILLESCPDQHKNWLERKLNYANEITLKERIEDILSPFDSLFVSERKKNSFIRKVVTARNYLTHYDNSLEKEYKSIDLYSIYKKLEAIFQITLLHYLEFSSEHIKNLVSQNFQLHKTLHETD